ncbi:MAG: Dam family site-specific DNA-(adenine-N6)-methyltransferase [Caldilineaceae bacterium]|nr:Dam family site-specific DNA-(adenine-N6)-methyltransferase [Caldilineaceae bacterium]
MKPFLKWAGNKYQIVDRIKAQLPAGKRLIEPFVGSGAVFMNTHYDRYLLADANVDLIRLYQYLQAEGDAFIDYSRQFFVPANNGKDQFYHFRTEFNTTTDSRYKSALFIYLNKHCFNGLCRYNQKGEYNVPFGRYKKPYFPEKEMRFFYEHAQNANFRHADFAEVMGDAEPGDVIYCDPPYVPLSETANFTSYSAGGFGVAEQQALAQAAAACAKRGIPVIISNHDTDFVREEYNGARFVAFDVQRYISCNGSNRGKAAELLAVFDASPAREVEQPA